MYSFQCYDSVFSNKSFNLTCDFYSFNNGVYELHTILANRLTQKEIITLISSKYVLSIYDTKKGVYLHV